MRVSPIETPGTNGANVLRIVRRAPVCIPVRLKSRSETLRKEKSQSSWQFARLSFAGEGAWSLKRVGVFFPLSGPTSYGRDPHDHLAVGGGPEPRVAGPQLAEDVEDGVAAVVVEDSP